MAKFKKGDRVRCVRPDSWIDREFDVGDIVIFEKETNHKIVFVAGDGSKLWADRWELATPSPIPDTVTIGGVEYVRKPKLEHVWAWGQWARVKEGNAYYSGQIVFIVGGVDNGIVPFTSHYTVGGHVDGVLPSMLEYISTATIPE